MTAHEDHDAVIVGASIAGCTAAILLARAGARVALIEKRPDAQAFKRVCGHYFQSSSVPTLERIGLLEPMEAVGALRTRVRMWTRWGWVEPPAGALVPSSVNLRREKFDPLIRRMAADTSGVDLILGSTARELLRDEQGRVCGVEVHDRESNPTRLPTRLVVGADGRDSRVATLAAVAHKTIPHNRFSYGAYFEGPKPVGWPNGTAWFLDPQWAAVFPTDEGLNFYAVMPTKDRLPEFRADPLAALTTFIADIPEPPPILDSRPVGPIVGKLEMPNVMRAPTAPGLALVGDAALATDPLWGVGCGFALQSGEWLADSVAPALVDTRGSLVGESLEQGLERYRRRYAKGLRGHAFMIHDYANGRRMSPPERLLFSAATRDERVARTFEAFGSRNMPPGRMLASAAPRAMLVNARHALSGGAR